MPSRPLPRMFHKLDIRTFILYMAESQRSQREAHQEQKRSFQVVSIGACSATPRGESLQDIQCELQPTSSGTNSPSECRSAALQRSIGYLLERDVGCGATDRHPEIANVVK